MVTVEFNQSCNSATITIPSEVETYTVEVIDMSTKSPIDFTSEYVNGEYIVEVDFESQTILEVSLTSLDNVVVDIYPILLNCSSLKCLMSSNKKDVIAQLKSCSIGNETSLLEATNRVVISNTKLKKYNLGLEGLSYLESLCDNDNCESC